MGDNWKDIHTREYTQSTWIDKPSMFAEKALPYFPETGLVLDLGAGQGQDSRFFAERGYRVVSTDLEEAALELNKQKLSAELAANVTVQKLDLREKLPFEADAFDVVYAHLSLHYFDAVTTQCIFDEIFRVLKPGGVFAFLVNSIHDPEYNTGEVIESDYFRVDGLLKRYFSVEAAETFAHAFTAEISDDGGETYKDSAKGIHNLIRFIGIKPGGQPRG